MLIDENSKRPPDNMQEIPYLNNNPQRLGLRYDQKNININNEITGKPISYRPLSGQHVLQHGQVLLSRCLWRPWGIWKFVSIE